MSVAHNDGAERRESASAHLPIKDGGEKDGGGVSGRGEE